MTNIIKSMKQHIENLLLEMDNIQKRNESLLTEIGVNEEVIRKKSIEVESFKAAVTKLEST